MAESLIKKESVCYGTELNGYSRIEDTRTGIIIGINPSNDRMYIVDKNGNLTMFVLTKAT